MIIVAIVSIPLSLTIILHYHSAIESTVVRTSIIKNSYALHIASLSFAILLGVISGVALYSHMGYFTKKSLKTGSKYVKNM